MAQDAGLSPVGIQLFGTNRTSTTRVFGQVIIRGNLIRPLDGVTDARDSVGINLNSVDEALIESNVINVATPDNALKHTVCDKVKPFNNQTSAGVFRPGWDTAKLVHDAELTTDVQDVLLEL